MHRVRVRRTRPRFLVNVAVDDLPARVCTTFPNKVIVVDKVFALGHPPCTPGVAEAVAEDVCPGHVAVVD